MTSSAYGNVRKMGILHRSMLMVMTDWEFSYTAEFGAKPRNNVEINCFPVPVFYYGDISKVKDKVGLDMAYA